MRTEGKVGWAEVWRQTRRCVWRVEGQTGWTRGLGVSACASAWEVLGTISERSAEAKTQAGEFSCDP